MDKTIRVEAGGYSYLPGPFQYSSGVVADAGQRIERVRFPEPVPIAAGFDAIERYFGERELPLARFCACELRSPAPFTEQEFTAFNRIYVGTLERWGIFRDEANPVARSNVCPAEAPPAEPSFEAFCHTSPAGSAAPPNFVVSGAAEASEGPGSYRERIVRHGETSREALREKARFVLSTLESRMAGLGVEWGQATATQAYTVCDFNADLAREIAARGAAPHGLSWSFARPPVEGLAFEMDVRGVDVEGVIAPAL